MKRLFVNKVLFYTYDNLGRLSARHMAGTSYNIETYTYDIRSRTTGISHPSFIQDLAYSYGGDVTSTGWKRSPTDTRKAYDFTYDGLHRLKTAAYKEGSTTNHHYTENVNGYDLNGNITGLSRHGRTGASSWGVIDSLAMTRTGNQLTSVTDVGVSAYSGDFNTSGTTSTYDANGAMISDTGRGISSITWNEINLPKTVTFTNGSTIDYYYAADGTKLQEIRTVSGTAMKIDWCGDLVIEKVGSGTRTAKRLRLDGAYVDLTQTTPVPRHFVRDHLGSTRAVVSDLGTVLETDDFYPLGGPLPTTTTIQPEKYQGKEWNTAASFNVYDFGARLYDPGLGRWISQDPMAEGYMFHSPYLFCAGNPMKFVDPEGLLANPVYNSLGDYRGNTIEGFVGEVIIYDGDIDFFVMTASDFLYGMDLDIKTMKGNATVYDVVRDELSDNAKSKIWTHIVSQMEGQPVYDEVFSLSTLSNGFIGFSSIYTGSWNSDMKQKAIIGTDLYSYETTVENIQSSVVVHEWYSHIMKGNSDLLKSHRLAYKNVINYKALWDNTTDAYKGFIVRRLMDYTKKETNRSHVEPLYRNIYERYHLCY